ncbi:MAG: hypothetical protein IKJ27_00140 [Clostridia bacterium]|nr:hypothetical protein [Clostridia bacterium]
MMESVYERMERENSKWKAAMFRVKQQLPYEIKKMYAARRALQFQRECGLRDLNYHVSVGGLDSITLYLFLLSIGIEDVKAVSVSSLENKTIRKVHKALHIEALKPSMREDGTRWTKAKILQEFGFPVLSKEIAAKIELLQNPSEKNKTVRHAIITGETGEYGGFQTSSRMKLSQIWLEKFGGYENENEGVNYSKPDFLVSSKCCYYLKEKPCDDWAKEHNSVPYLGLMASEGGRRAKGLMLHGCNYFGSSTIRSAPFAIFDRQDILRLALEMDKWYQEHWKKFGFDYVESVIPKVYGEIAKDSKGRLYTTKAQRTGCEICGFGVHMEKRPHRFDLLREQNPKAWQYWMFDCCTDSDGNKYGWGKVLYYIGVPYEWDGACMVNEVGQLSLF